MLITRNLQRFRVGSRRRLHRQNVFEDRIGVLRLFQRFALLNLLQPIPHAVEIPPIRFEFRIGDVAKVFGKLRMQIFKSLPTGLRIVFRNSLAGFPFGQPSTNTFPVPPEPIFRLRNFAVAKSHGDFRNKGPLLVPLELPGCQPQ